MKFVRDQAVLRAQEAGGEKRRAGIAARVQILGDMPEIKTEVRRRILEELKSSGAVGPAGAGRS